MFRSSPNNIFGFIAQLKWYYIDSLKGRLIALSLGLSLTLLWILVVFSTTIQQHKFSQVLLNQQLASTHRLAAAIDFELRQRIELLTRTAERLPSDLSPQSLDSHLPKLASLPLSFSVGVAVIGLDGRSIADYPALPGRRGSYVGDRQHFQRVIETGKPIIGKPFMSRLLQRPVFMIAVPVLDQAGKVRAVLVGGTDLGTPNFLGFSFDLKIPGEGQFYIVSPQDKLILASTDPALALAAPPVRGTIAIYDRFTEGFSGSAISPNIRGKSTLFSGSHIPITNWIVTATLPAEVAFQPVTTMRHYLTAIAIIMTMLAILVAHWITQRLLTPLDEAGKAIKQMAQGEAPQLPLPVKSKGEIGGIVHHVNHLVEGHHRSQTALAVSQQRLEAIVQNAQDAIFVHTHGCFVYLNAAALRLFGADSPDSLVGKSILARLHPSSHAIAMERIHLVSEEKKSVPAIELKLLRLDNSIVYARISAIPLNYENDNSSLSYARDITERKMAEIELRKSEERFRRLVALSSEWYWEHDENYVVTTAAGWRALKNGMIPQYSIGKNAWKIADLDKPFWQAHRATLRARLPFTDLEYMHREADGKIAWYSVSGEPMFDEDGNYKGYRGTGKDITARKLGEEELRQSRTRIRELAAHQESIKEQERKRIARDLHDHLGQTLLAIRLDAATLAGQTAAAHPKLHATSHLMLRHIDEAMKSIKEIINDLRPFVLDLGLVAAMEWQVREFQRWSGIECELEVDEEDLYRHLNENQATALFRVLQESMANIARHAKASQVKIAMHMKGDQLEMTIADNGVGIDPEQRDKKRKFGLTGIDERIKALGGKFSVDSTPGKGTTLHLSIPVFVPSSAEIQVF